MRGLNLPIDPWAHARAVPVVPAASDASESSETSAAPAALASDALEFFATSPRGTADLLLAELREFGAESAKENAGGVFFRGTLAVAYRACLWSRVANRVLLILARFPAPDADALYAGVQTLDWPRHLAPTGTLAVDAAASRSQLTHTQFIAQRTKDAIVDACRTPEGVRPDVDTQQPDVRINLYIDRDLAQVAIDLGGGSLHRRGYRRGPGAAPLKENLAAALLLRAGWQPLAVAGAPLVDPMCGTGTLLIEAALVAGDIAPGLLRGDCGCANWLGHDPALWATLWHEAQARLAAGVGRAGAIVGYDIDPDAVHVAWENIERAGLLGVVHVETRELAEADPPPGAPGLVICNPPYGERLGEHVELVQLYRRLGERLRARFTGWEAAIFTGNPGLGLELGLKAFRTHTLFNGALECRLLRIHLQATSFAPQVPPGSVRVARAQQRIAELATPSPGAAMFANRLRKNVRLLGRWAARAGVSCYRLYDADMPEYAIAIDLYTSTERWLHVQEYAAPATIDEAHARTRLDEALSVLPALLEVPIERIVFKRRERQRGTAQYEKQADAGNFIEVEEHGVRLLVNLRDYLDTGLFLDHRTTRARLRAAAHDRDVLNLFSYTASASVQAAAGGARTTTSVDMSSTYSGWARRNFALNDFPEYAHRVVVADCIRWLEEAPVSPCGLIFLDPPTFSNSKRMEDTLDIQRDHVALIDQCLRRLAPDGLLVFSTNLRRFKFDREAFPDLAIEDWSAPTLPQDFARNPRIHQCFALQRPA